MRLQRYIYEEEFGPTPTGSYVVNKCHNNLCVNRKHLILTTNPNIFNRKDISYHKQDNGCWICNDLNNNARVKRLSRNGISIHPRRILFERIFFKVPIGIYLPAGCGNPLCINPDHAVLRDHSKHTYQIAIIIDPITGCHNVVSHYSHENGYPYIQVSHKRIPIHRYVWKIKYGRIPKGMVVRHKCDNKPCCNIEHLELGSQADNYADSQKRGLIRCVLDPDIVREMRLNSSVTDKEYAERFGVLEKTIRKARARITWRHID